MKGINVKKLEGLVFMILFFTIFGFIAHTMGLKNMLSTIMATAHDLLLNTVFYIMSITVLAGAFGNLMIEFGIVRILEFLLTPFMRPIFNLPGVASLGALMTFFSDNPAIISLANEKHFRRFFTPAQFVSLTNFGTSFGMGLIVITFMMGKGFFASAIIGFIGAIIGAAVSTRIMQHLIKDIIGDDHDDHVVIEDVDKLSLESDGGLFMRLLNSVLDGGQKGVDLGLSIIPGVLIISTMVMLLTFGMKDPAAGYQGLAYEGVPYLPKMASYLQWPFELLFGFESPEAIAFPITSLGAVGAALSLVPTFIEKGIIGGNEIAVFTAMGMCLSGYLSTHAAMLDALKYRNLTSKAIFSHTIGGVCAGVCAHYIFVICAWCNFAV